MGCYGSEAAFGDKVYDGGSSGANFDVASHYAKTKEKRYFATARVDGDGHMFAFEKLSGRPDQQGGGCEHQCADRPDMMCGCADQSCTGPVLAGEQHNRRWSVYEIVR